MSVKSIIIGIVLVLGLASVASAQAVTSASKPTWDQPGAASLAEAQAYTFKYYVDGSTTGTTAIGVTCAGTTTITCAGTMPTGLTAGTHTIAVSATNAAGESPKSNVVSFAFVVVPSAPLNLRIQ